MWGRDPESDDVRESLERFSMNEAQFFRVPVQPSPRLIEPKDVLCRSFGNSPKMPQTIVGGGT